MRSYDVQVHTTCLKGQQCFVTTVTVTAADEADARKAVHSRNPMRRLVWDGLEAWTEMAYAKRQAEATM